ncbi:MAG TPA: hypothetical protein VK612_02145 [Pyrinomonadaceae bacterium]|nr:hypothetical protein [Pyrinomonadaceae bacterium]
MERAEAGKIRLRHLGRSSVSILLVFLTLFIIDCSPNQRIINSSAEQTREESKEPRPAATVNSFEQDIESMRTADFIFIYVFRRKDGGPLDADDRRYASQVIPQEMNRRTISDSGKAIIVGSNFRMPEDNLKVLSERFASEDLSRKNEADKGSIPVR